MRGVRIALGVGLGLLVTAIGLVLAYSPMSVAHTNGISAYSEIAATQRSAGACQPDETLPRNVSSIRLSLEATIGPSVTVEAFSGARLLTQGRRGAGWIGDSVTVPVTQVDHAASNVRICFALGPTRQRIALVGVRTAAPVAAKSQGEALPGRIKIEYLRPDHSSWWSRALSVARRMGLGHAFSGAWIALLVAALTGMFTILTSWLVVRELR